MQLSLHGITDQGKVRKANEDAFLIDEAHQVFAVADGLGGLPGGAEASQRIVERLKQTYRSVDATEERADLGELILGINKILTKEGHEAHPFTGSGSTLTIAQLIGDQLLIGHVGDSAAYHLRGDDFNKITIDHTMEQEFIERVGESGRTMMPPEYPHTLTRCVGQTDTLRVDQSRLTIAPGDRLLLCTDGLNKVVTKQQIHASLQADQSAEAICQGLVDDSNAEGGPDNITVVVVFIQ
ncbi:MAG: serine/threonine protein phosphatase PrpC [Lentimonas sp.]|jgi:serine/threonine protein phosphatase PrpC